MTEWWVVALIVSWPLSGFGVWVFVVRDRREIRVGDVFVFPVMVAMGWMTVLIWLIANANDGKVLWRW